MEDIVPTPATRTAFGDLLFVDEVAQQLRRSVDAVRWLINSGQLRAAKVGGRVMVRQSDLNKLIDDAFKDAS